MKIRISECTAIKLAKRFKEGKITLSQLVKEISEYGHHYGRYSPLPRILFQDKLADELKDVAPLKGESYVEHWDPKVITMGKEE